MLPAHPLANSMNASAAAWADSDSEEEDADEAAVAEPLGVFALSDILAAMTHLSDTSGFACGAKGEP